MAKPKRSASTHRRHSNPDVSVRRSLGPIVAATVVLTVAVATWGGRPVTGESLIQLLIFALPLAGIFALAATGLVVVYTTTGVFNFAQGAIGMLAAYVYWQLHVDWGWPNVLSVAVTVLGFAPAFGWMLNRLIMRHLVGKDLVVQLMVTVGLLLGFIGVANTIWDPNQSHTVNPFFGIEGFQISGVTLTWHRLIALVVAVVLVVGLRFLLYATRLGIAMRAVVDNQGLAQLSGVPSERVSSFSWMLGSCLAALAGVLYANEIGVGASLVLATLVPAFAAAAVGRMRSLPLTYLWALILALLMQFASVYLSFTGDWQPAKERIPEVMLFVVLLLLPPASLKFARFSGVRRRARVVPPRQGAIGLAVLVVTMPLFGLLQSATNLSRLTLAMGLAIVALSLVPLTGWAGQVSFAPLAFAGIGAAAFAHFGGESGRPLAILIGAIAAAPVGAALSLIAVRLQGLYLGLATFAFAYFTRDAILNNSRMYGGVSLTTPRQTWFGISFSGNQAYLTLLTVVFAIIALALMAIRTSSFGRRLVAMRDSEAASATVGVNIFETKVVVFTISAFVAGLGGSFLAMFYINTDSGRFEAIAGLGLVLQMVVGGIALVSGAVFAGVFQLPIIILREKSAEVSWLLWLEPKLRGLEQIAPGFAALGIIQNPEGAVVAVGKGFAPLVPGDTAARKVASAERARKAERYAAQSSEIGLSIALTASSIAEVERQLRVTDALAPRGSS